MIKQYEFKDFVFAMNMGYNLKLFWKIFRIYHAYCLLENHNFIACLSYSSGVVGEFGAFYFREINERAGVYDDEYFYFLLYKEFLLSKLRYNVNDSLYLKIKYAKNIKELKGVYHIDCEDENDKFYMDNTQRNLNYYIERLQKFVPKNILNKVKDIRVFALGVMTSEVYRDILMFKNDLENWLKSPPKTTKKFKIPSKKEVGYFHDEIYKVYFGSRDLIFDGDYNLIKFNNYKLLFEDDNIRKLTEFEGYAYSSVIREDEEKLEFYLEIFGNNVNSLIIECDNVEIIELES